MKKQWVFAMFVLLLGALTAAPFAQEASQEDMQKAMQEAYMKAGQPGEHHQHLADLAGSWDYTSKMWEDPSAPPVESKGTCERTMILNGRYLREEFTGNFMGMPFTGIGITGYDNVSKTYQSIWIDNMSTTMLFGTGQSSDEGKKLEIVSEYTDIMTGQPATMRSVTTLVDEKKQIAEYFGAGPDGKEFKAMEFIFTRK